MIPPSDNCLMSLKMQYKRLSKLYPFVPVLMIVVGLTLAIVFQLRAWRKLTTYNFTEVVHIHAENDQTGDNTAVFGSLQAFHEGYKLGKTTERMSLYGIFSFAVGTVWLIMWKAFAKRALLLFEYDE